MTPKEHMLVVMIMAKQLQQVKIIIDILQSREILQGDDAKAFLTAMSTDLQSNAAVLRDVKKEYIKYATHLGIETGLEPRL